MSWSLALHNGDLALNGSSLGTVTRQPKLVQDLRCALLERMGTDPAHPGFGSLIDGGLTPDGVYHNSLIGNTDWQMTTTMIEVEIRRICNDYRSRQLVRARSDQFTYGHPTLEPSETLIRVNGVDFALIGGDLLVKVSITVGNGSQTTLNLPIASPTLITS